MTNHLHTEGRPYYGHGQVLCFSCGGSVGKVIESVNHGYNVDALEQAEISWLLDQAREHERKHPSHIVKTYTFARTDGDNE